MNKLFFKGISPFLLIGMSVALLPGFKRRSTPLPIPSLPEMGESVDYKEAKQGITLRAKRLSKPETEQILGKRAGRLWHQSRLRKTKRRKRACRSRKTEQIIPIQLSIINRTDRSVTIRNEDIDLQLVDGKTVEKRLRRSSFFAAVGTAITSVAVMASLLALTNGLINIAFLGCCGGAKISPLLASSAYIGAIFFGYGSMFTFLATPVVTTHKAMKTTTENKRVKKTIDKNSFENMIQVEPGQEVNTLIFVAEDDYKENFNIAIQDTAFNVTLKAS